jgi:flagellar secretion chaperone FliS
MATLPPRSPISHYRSVDAYAATSSGDRVELILRMMSAAVDRLTTARGYMLRRETAAKGQEIGRAIGIIDGLRTALNTADGGSIAENLESLYDYMMRRLLEANVNDDERRVDEVIELLQEIRSGWAAIS